MFALPGRGGFAGQAAGTHHLIKTASAHLVESAEDILGHLGDVGRLLEKASAVGQVEAKDAELFEAVAEDRVALRVVEAARPGRKAAIADPGRKSSRRFRRKGFLLDDLVDATDLLPQIVVAGNDPACRYAAWWFAWRRTRFGRKG